MTIGTVFGRIAGQAPAVLTGFRLCFASTASGTILHCEVADRARRGGAWPAAVDLQPEIGDGDAGLKRVP
ncbi:hypothetical protein ACXYMW_09060 [Roseivivax sp. CAU 1761]